MAKSKPKKPTCNCPNTCLCGRPSVATTYLPVGNVFVGLHDVTEPHQVCEYHAEKSKEKGYTVEYYAKTI